MTAKAATLPMEGSIGVKDVRLETGPTPAPLVRQADSTLEMIERIVDRAGVDVLERIIAMRDRERGQHAEDAFNIAFTAMQPEIPTIIEHAKTDKATYAPLEDIIEIIRPIYSRHGFSLGFQTEWLNDGKVVKVIGVLTHTEGHARRSEFVSPADVGPGRNAIQALGSTVTYGKRYVTKDLFCIVTRDAKTGRGEDDDGKRSDKGKQPEAPTGYDDFMADLAKQAKDGTAKLFAAWNKSKPEYRQYVTKHEREKWEALKADAEKVPS